VVVLAGSGVQTEARTVTPAPEAALDCWVSQVGTALLVARVVLAKVVLAKVLVATAAAPVRTAGSAM